MMLHINSRMAMSTQITQARQTVLAALPIRSYGTLKTTHTSVSNITRPIVGPFIKQQRASVRVLAGNGTEPDNDTKNNSLIGSVGLFAVWGAALAYAFFLSPNQTPLRDMYFLEKLVGLGQPDGVQINAIFTQLFFIMGIWPLVYSALLIPAAKSANGVPAWPFVGLSFGAGAFGLLPFFALWQPGGAPELPPSKEDTEGLGNVMLKGMESPFLAFGLLAGTLYCFSQLAVAGAPAWNEYFRLFDESRFVHVTSFDFLICTTFAPYWMYNDANLRNWGPRDTLLPLFSVLPVIGPVLYLCLRPRASIS